MASNPPITSVHSSGTLDLQTRINRFLNTIEPHARFFLAQGRTHLDSLVERDKTQNRSLKPDKTGWAMAGYDGTTSLVGVTADADGETRGSHVSVSAMSSVSQRGGRVARMRDRHGNTAMTLKPAGGRIQTSGVKAKSIGLIAPLPDTSSSPPIQPWKDIKPKTSQQELLDGDIRLKPVVEIPIRSPQREDVQCPPDEQSHAREEKNEKVKKRKLVPAGERQNENDAKKSRRHPEAISESKAWQGKGDSRHAAKQQTHSRALVDSSSKINVTIKSRETNKNETKASRKVLGTTTAAKPPRRQTDPQVAEDQAREEILAVRRGKRREKMALKTASGPVSKKDDVKLRARESTEDDCDDDVDRSKGKRKQRTGKKNVGDIVGKSAEDHKEPSMALLKAYQVSGHLDSRRRITLPTTRLRSGLFGKGMISGRISRKVKGSEHPPDLQFQTEAFLKRKRRPTSPSSSFTEGDTTDKKPIHSQSSVSSTAKHRKATVAKRKTANDSRKVKRKTKPACSEMSVSIEEDGITEKQSKIPTEAGERQASPEWPTTLAEGDEPEEPVHVKDDARSASPVNVAQNVTDADAEEVVQKSDTIVPEPHSLEGIDVDLVETNIHAVAVIPNSAAIREEKEPAGRDQHSPQRYQDGSCSPSLDTESYADMLAQALAGSASVASSGPVMGPERIDDGDMVSLQDDGYPREEVVYLDHVQRGSEPVDCDFSHVYEDRLHEERDIGTDWNSAYGIGGQAVGQCNVEEPAYQEIVLDATLSPKHMTPVVADHVDERTSGNASGAFRHEVAQLSDTPAPVSSFESVLELEVDGRDRVADAAQNDTLDVFGTDAEQARKVLYGTRRHR